jgi:hypothetical protein
MADGRVSWPSPRNAPAPVGTVKCCRRRSGRDHGNPTADQISRRPRQSVDHLPSDIGSSLKANLKPRCPPRKCSAAWSLRQRPELTIRSFILLRSMTDPQGASGPVVAAWPTLPRRLTRRCATGGHRPPRHIEERLLFAVAQLEVPAWTTGVLTPRALANVRSIHVRAGRCLELVSARRIAASVRRGLGERRHRKDTSEKDKSEKLLHDTLLSEFVSRIAVIHGLTFDRWVVTRAAALAELLVTARSCVDRNAWNADFVTTTYEH